MQKKCFSLLFAFFIAQLAYAQSPETLIITKYETQHADEVIKEFVKFLSIPNIASDTAKIRKNAAFVVEMMQKRGIQNIQLLQAATTGTPPVVYGEVKVPGAKQTLIFYAH
ncbi:MAG: hypothetical protein ABIN25_06145, partial [Ginsengibacter sp.]